MTARLRAALSVAATTLVLLAWGAVPAAPPSLRVHLIHGRALDVLDCRIDGGRATLTLPDGGTIAFPSSLVARIEETHPDPAPLDAASSPMREEPVQPASGAADVDTGDLDQATAGSPVEVSRVETIDMLIRSAAGRHHLEPELLAAVIAVESGYRKGAVSPKGAQGLMQLMPGTANDLAVKDPFDAKQNIEAGARYLRQLLDQHGDSYVDALAAYNAGATRVARYRGLPPYRETVTYIGRVLKRYRSPQPSPAGSPSGQ